MSASSRLAMNDRLIMGLPPGTSIKNACVSGDK